VIYAAEMLVAGQEQATSNYGCLGQDERIMDFLRWEQSLRADFCCDIRHEGRVTDQIQQGAKAVLLAYEANGLLGRLPDGIGFTRVTQEGQFIQNAGNNDNVMTRQALIKKRQGVQNRMNTHRKVKEHVGINGQAQGLHGHRGAQPLAGATDAAGPR